MYDVKEKIQKLSEIVADLTTRIQQNTVDALMIITAHKETDVEYRYEMGRLSVFEWLGMLEIAKDVIKDEFDDIEDL